MIKTISKTGFVRKLGIAVVSLFIMFSASATYTEANNSEQGGISAEAAYQLGLGLRIGLVSRGERDTIGIESRAINIGFHANGYFQSEAAIHAVNSFAAVQAPASYVRIAGNIMNFDNARYIANSHIGERVAVPVLVSNSNWSVYVGPFPTFGEAEQAALQLGGTAIPPNPTRITITDGNVPVVLFDNVLGFTQFADPSGITAIDSGRYRGVIEPFIKDGNFTAVNIINIEEYLLSVVPSEMPAQWHIEALKAQAVAARTYALTRLDARIEDGFNLCDTVQTQVYRGVEAEHANTTRAVQETRGIMAFHNGRLINAVYFSSSGGHTENSENVWTNNVPYLRGVREIAETGYMQWSRNFTLQQLTYFMAQNGHNIGNVTSVRYRHASESNRVIELTFVGTNGTATYTNDGIRRAFRHSAEGSLQSTNFTVNNITANTAPPEPPVAPAAYINVVDVNGVSRRIAVSDISGMFGGDALIRKYTMPSASSTSAQTVVNSGSIVINGRGWGHGAGMSQFGAQGMAEAGFTFRQILQHYYTDIEVR